MSTDANAIQNKAAQALTQKRLIAVEGIDGSGKTTLVSHVQRVVGEYLKNRAYPNPTVSVFDAWSANEWTGKLRGLFVGGIGDNRTEMLLAQAARRALVVEHLLPSMQAGVFCVVDRFIYSTIAYQCETVRDLELYLDLVAGFNERVIPGLTLYLNADYATARARAEKRGALDSFESRGELFYDKLDVGFRLGFSVLSSVSDTYSIEVDANQDLDSVKEKVSFIVETYLDSMFVSGQSNPDWLKEHNITTVERGP